MHRILLLGAGKIGRMIARLLVDAGDYSVTVADADASALERLSQRIEVSAQQVSAKQQVSTQHVSTQRVSTQRVDAGDRQQLLEAMHGCDSVISALSFRFNPLIARVALESGASYFDLTEDVETTRLVRAVAEQANPGQIFMPQCGLAPGFISIVAHHVAQEFDELDTLQMRVGALPQFPTGALKYNLTWSTDGLINEYCNPCEAIHAGKQLDVLPLEGLEHFSLDGVRYEAFNTSGGLGTLCETLAGKVRELNYKTVRYLGHQEMMLLLVKELRLDSRRDLLKDILEHAVPITFQDVVVTFCTVTGRRNGQLVQISDARKIYHEEIAGENWSAIQITTAGGICAVVDMHAHGKLPSQGFVLQEQVALPDFLANRFGKCYDSQQSTKFSRIGEP